MGISISNPNKSSRAWRQFTLEDILSVDYQQNTENRSSSMLGQNRLSIEVSDGLPNTSRLCCRSAVELFDLMSDQIRRSTEGNVKAAILNVRKAKNSDDLELNEMSETNSSWSKEAKYDTIFIHLEAVWSWKKRVRALPKHAVSTMRSNNSHWVSPLYSRIRMRTHDSELNIYQCVNYNLNCYLKACMMIRRSGVREKCAR